MTEYTLSAQDHKENEEIVLDEHCAHVAFSNAQVNYSNMLNLVQKRKTSFWKRMEDVYGHPFRKEHWKIDSDTGKITRLTDES